MPPQLDFPRKRPLSYPVMTRPTSFVIGVALAVGLLAWGCGSKSSSDAAVVKIVATGNVHGEIEPCGCRVPLGGLARKATFIHTLRDSKIPYLVVDGGDLFFSKAQLDGDDLATEKIRARTLVEGFNRIGTDAVAIGEKDLAAGLSFLQSLAEAAQFPLLSANLTDEQGKLLFAPYTIVQKGELRIGLVGASSAIPAGDGYRSQPLLPALKKVVKELQSRTDLLVLLFHGQDVDKQQIMASGLPIHLMLQSHVTRYERKFGRGSIPTASFGSQGKYLNVITASIKVPGEPLVDLSVHQRTLDFVASSMKRLRRNQPKDVLLEELYADQPRALERISELREREAQARQVIESAVNTLETETISLGPAVKFDEELLSIVTLAKQAMVQVPGSPGVEADPASL